MTPPIAFPDRRNGTFAQLDVNIKALVPIPTRRAGGLLPLRYYDCRCLFGFPHRSGKHRRIGLWSAQSMCQASLGLGRDQHDERKIEHGGPL
jgi:hypothetical protein